MYFKHCYFIFTILFLFPFLSNSQLVDYSKVKIYTDSKGLEELMKLGVGIDHGITKKNTFFISDFSVRDIEILDENGYKYEVLIKDVSAYYVKRNEEAIQKSGGNDGARNDCQPVTGSTGPSFVTPDNFTLGSMGGYYTYDECMDELDKMAALYPSIISTKTPIDTFETVEGRSIYYLEISNSPDTDNANPYVLYNSIHHAREPGSLSQLIYYMWYLLENYGTNEEVTYLVDNTQMIFIPMLNPDGYIHNEVTNPNGGGMWRKNRRDNGDGNFGVDLNRNYAYQWNTTGVSANTNSDIYPGTSAFSEVETTAMKWLLERYPFQFALNAHTYSNLLLYPIGATDEEFAEHHDYFDAISGHMCSHNNYQHMKSSGLYPASGGSDDYMYKMDVGVGLKDTIFSMTPEIGSDFWPESTKIEGLCRENVFPNIILAHLTHRYAVVNETDPSTVDNPTGFFSHEIKRLGLEDGEFTVSIAPITGIESVGDGVVYNLGLKQTALGEISYVLTDDIALGDPIIYELLTDNGVWVRRDTIRKFFGTPTLQFSDDATTAENWNGTWGLTNTTFVSAPNSFTDSPGGDYLPNEFATYTLVNDVDLTNATNGMVRFYAKWDIEDNWDYVAFEISTDNQNTWEPLCGKYTNAGVEQLGWAGQNQGIQPVGEPIYDGVQESWVLEEVDLTSYLGETISLRFLLHSDGAVEHDGFYFDDFQLLYTTDPTIGLTALQSDEIKVYPNPANDIVYLDFNNYLPQKEVLIYDVSGKVVAKHSLHGKSKKIQLPVQHLPEGVYTVKFTDEELQHIVKRIVVLN